MDTREKIVDLTNASERLARGPWLVVLGLFDPLAAVQATRLASLRTRGRKILALVLEDEDTLLPAEARAVLVAALRDVDLVSMTPPETWKSILCDGMGFEIMEDLPAERERSAEFVRFVLDRQNGASVSAGSE